MIKLAMYVELLYEGDLKSVSNGTGFSPYSRTMCGAGNAPEWGQKVMEISYGQCFKWSKCN